MTFRDFHHALRIMLNLEPEELVAAGVMPSLDSSDFIAYNKSPFTWFIRTDDARAQKLFALVEMRLFNSAVGYVP